MDQLKTIGPDIVGQRALFDYSVLDAETRIVVQQRAREIETIAKRMASDVVEIGGKLAEVKDKLGGNGRFNDWLAAELRWSERAAYNFIAVWQRFNAANFALENVAVSALYLLAAPSTPAEAVDVARQIADSGQKVTHGVAKEIVRQAKAKQPKQKELIEEPEELADESEEDTGFDSAAHVVESGPDPTIGRRVTSPPGAYSKTTTEPDGPTQAAVAPSPTVDRLAAWYKTRVEITITLMPGGDGATRKVMHSVRAGEGMPFVELTTGEEDLVGSLPTTTFGLLEKAYEAFAKKPEARPAKKPTVKSKPVAKKPAAKTTTKGGKK